MSNFFANSLRLPDWIRTRKGWTIALFCVSAAFYAVQSTRSLDGFRVSRPPIVQASLDNQNCPEVLQYSTPWNFPENSLNFPHPTTLARDNLRRNSSYITSFAVAGFTNEFIAYMNLMYLGMQTGRIPIVPPIIPSAHVSSNAGTLLFGHIFNLTVLRNNLRHPILEWADVKSISSDASIINENEATDPRLERFGCWSTRPQTSNNPTWVRSSENLLKLDMSFTRVPTFAYYGDKNKDEMHTTFPGLAATVWPRYPHQSARNLPIMAQSRFGSRLQPDEQLSCFDFLFFVTTGLQAFEFENRWSPVWNTVGTHLRFTDSMMDLANGYLRRALGIDGDIPPMITVHIRRGDFKDMCKAGKTPPCYLPLDNYRQAVDDVRKQVLQTHNIDITRVLVASDEEDPAFWNELTSYGWNSINHTAERTMERLGEWYPLLIDKATLSMGVGFVGTSPSTFSVLNARRVEDWNNGITRMLSYFD